MEVKQIAVRLDAATAEQLKLRAAIEHRSVNEIVSEAIQEYLQSHTVPRVRMLEMVRAIANEDASLLKTLSDA
jgi:plasmid stability protein